MSYAGIIYKEGEVHGSLERPSASPSLGSPELDVQMRRADAEGGILEEHLRQACAEIDRRLRAGEDARAETFLVRCPDIAGNDESAVELIYTEFVTREELGLKPTADEFLARFPQWRAPLREQLRMHDLLGSDGLSLSLSSFGVRQSIGEAGGDDANPDQSTSDPGHRIGAYTVLDEIGRGSTGVVYKARHDPLNRLVALKVIPNEKNALGCESLRFRTEAEAAARLLHPNIVQVFEVGESDGRLFLALEYVAGGTLATRIAGQPQSPQESARLIEVLARAVDHAHRHEIIHRDLKPANVLIAADGTPKITDFGLAKLLDRQELQTTTGSIVGTPCYMAPEQADGQINSASPACDVYALGAILYEMLTGRPPFRAHALLETLRQVVTDDPLPPERLQSGIPGDLAMICMKCLRKEPQSRYASGIALAEDLHRFQSGEPIHARPIGVWERGRKWAKRRPSLAAFLAVSILSTIVVLGGSLWYNARLSEAVAEARERRVDAENAQQDAERRRQEAVAQSKVIQKQYDDARRTLLTNQLARVEEIWKADSPRAKTLLEDEGHCPKDLRDFAWGLYYHLCTRDRVLEFPEPFYVTKIALAPDGRTLATAGLDGLVRLWDTSTKLERAIVAKHGRGTPCMGFSPNGRWLASGGNDRKVRVWDVKDGRELYVLEGHTNRVRAVVFSPDGMTIASGSTDQTIRLWTLKEENASIVLEGHTKEILSLAFSADGKFLASAGSDRQLRLWDVSTRKEHASLLIGDKANVPWLSFVSDTRVLAYFNVSGRSVGLWETDTQKIAREFRAFASHIKCAAISPDGQMLALANDDQTIRIFDPATGAERYHLWSDPRPPMQMAFSEDGRTLASLTDNGQRCHVWSTESRNSRDTAPAVENQRITCITTDTGGKILITGDSQGAIRRWDSETLVEQEMVGHHGARIWAIAQSGTFLATAGEDSIVQVRNLHTCQLAQTLVGHNKRVRDVAFSPNGAIVATASEDGTVKLWDPAKGIDLATLRADGAEMTAVAFSPDGMHLFTGSDDGAVRVWNVQSRKEQDLRKAHAKSVLFLVLSSDGKHMATGGPDGTVKLWAMDKFQVHLTLQGYSGFAFSAAFTPDGKTLATASGLRRTINVPGEVKLWDVATGHCRATLRRQSGPVRFICDGRSLISVDHFTALKVWPSIQKDIR